MRGNFPGHGRGGGRGCSWTDRRGERKSFVGTNNGVIVGVGIVTIRVWS